MRKLAILGVAVTAMALGATGASASDPIITPSPVGGQGCVSPAGDTCTFTATRNGGYVAGGDNWTLTVEIAADGDARDTNGDGKLRYVFDPSNAPVQGCGFFAPGSQVTTSAGDGSGLAAGNPFPEPTDPVIGANNDCATGLISPDNSNYTPVD